VGASLSERRYLFNPQAITQPRESHYATGLKQT